ncbi:carbohydrate porin [Kiritimatiellaeota bacterium B1221]|nr:carbohydrate porin [Kiritimatiellaeota bacterium B1221]
MKKTAITTVVATGLSSLVLYAQEINFNGYMRAGVGQNAEGGAATTYGNGGSGHTVGRLGDEADTYIEIGLGTTLWEEEGQSFRIQTLYAGGTTEGDTDLQGNSWQGIGDDGPWGGQRASFREVYAAAALDGYGIWAGKRFHQRKDIHIMDFYYVNNSGYGVGLEEVQLSGDKGKLNLAWIQNAENWQDDYSGGANGDTWRRINKIDLRWQDIKISENGSLELIGIYGQASLSDEQKANTTGDSDNTGWFLTLEHTQGGLPGGGFNKTVFQYGDGGYATIGAFTNHAGEVMDAVDGDGWRLIDWGVIESGRWNLGWSAMYAQRDVTEAIEGTNDFLLGENEFYNVVLRPSWEWDTVMSTVFELGYANNKAEGGDWQDLSKVTIAQQWAAGTSFWSRPAIRVYVSHYMGDEVDLRNADGTDQETMFGAQVEAWW